MDINTYLTSDFPDKEDMEEVWRQSWVTIDVEVRIPQNSLLGLTLKEVSYIWTGFIVFASMIELV